MSTKIKFSKFLDIKIFENICYFIGQTADFSISDLNDYYLSKSLILLFRYI